MTLVEAELMPKDGSKDEATAKALCTFVNRQRDAAHERRTLSCVSLGTTITEYLTAYQHYVSNCLCYLGILVSHITLSGSFLTS
jgi:hypothetical protein